MTTKNKYHREDATLTRCSLRSRACCAVPRRDLPHRRLRHYRGRVLLQGRAAGAEHDLGGVRLRDRVLRPPLPQVTRCPNPNPPAEHPSPASAGGSLALRCGPLAWRACRPRGPSARGQTPPPLVAAAHQSLSARKNTSSAPAPSAALCAPCHEWAAYETTTTKLNSLLLPSLSRTLFCVEKNGQKRQIQEKANAEGERAVSRRQGGGRRVGGKRASCCWGGRGREGRARCGA
jgi:hypothetical protein